MSKLHSLLNDFFYFNKNDLSPLMKSNLSQVSDKNDRFVLKIMVCYWLTSIGLTLYFDTYALGIIGGAIINALAWVGYRFVSGLPRRFILCLCLCLFSALFIHQQPGYVEPHFSFYASMYILTRYKDVRPLLIFICLTVFYYLSFSYLQSRSVTLLGMDVQLFSWEVWGSLRFYVFAFLTSSCVFAMIIRNHIIDFKKSQLLQSNLFDKKQRLKEDVAYRTEQINQKTESLKAMLDSLSEGILIIDQDICIKKEYSLFLEEILDEDNLADKPALDVLFNNSNLTSNNISNVKFVLESSLNKPLIQFEKSKHLLVNQYSINTKQGEKHLQIQWTPICNDNGFMKQILVCIDDRSLIRHLNTDNENNTRKLQLIGEVLMVDQQVLSEFMNYSYLALKQMNGVDSNHQTEVLEENLRTLYKIKENALEYGLIYFTRELQELETCIDNFKKDDNLIGHIQNFSRQNLLLQGIIKEYNTFNLKLERKNIKQTKDEFFIDKRSVDYLLSQFSVSDPSVVELPAIEHPSIEHSTEEEITDSLMKAKAYISSLSDEWAEQ